MQAIILDRNKSYLVKIGDVLKIDSINLKNDDILVFNNVLLFSNNDELKIGTPFVNDVKVTSRVLKNFKNDKIVSIKFRRRKHYMKKIGHRQNYTFIKIESINF